MENNNLKENKEINPDIETDEIKEKENSEVENACDETQKEMDEQQKQLEELQGQVDHMKDLAQRTQAEFMNYKKRVAKEMQDISTFANENIITQLLLVLDNFDRAIESEKDNDTPFLQGVIMIKKQLEDTLFKNGLEEIDALGQEFDPNFHHAVMQEEADEKNKVLEVFHPAVVQMVELIVVEVSVFKSAADDALDLCLLQLGHHAVHVVGLHLRSVECDDRAEVEEVG